MKEINNDNILETRGLTKRFGGLVAVNKFDLKVAKNKISSIIGPNGAGKTTLFNIIRGIYQADGGECFFKKARASKFKP